MPNFSVGTQIKRELEDFKKRIRLAKFQKDNAERVRFADVKKTGYDFNQTEMVNLIDLYYNSQFDSGPYDNQNQRKMFLAVGKFRSDVASKQIRVTPKSFRFIPDDFADPFTAYFLQKDFKEWVEDEEFAMTLETWVDKFPRYGSIVGKKVGNDIVDLPLQNIVAMEQTAESIQKATHFIEGHPKMRSWEIQAMSGWNTQGFALRYDEEYDVFERCGFVPAAWLLRQQGVTDPNVLKDAGENYVDARVIGAFPKNDIKREFHVFFSEANGDDRGYREAHYARAFGRWLGVGVMEDTLENQRAKNVVVNLIRKSLQWSGKRVFQSANADLTAKSLVRDVQDGEILEVGANGEIRIVPLDAKMNADFGSFLSEWEQNANQKTFTYEVGLMGAHTASAFRLGALLTQAAQAFFLGKKQILSRFVKEVIEDFEIPNFLRDMGNKDKVVAMVEGDPGYDALKKAGMDFLRSELTKMSFYSGKAMDASAMALQLSPFEVLKVWPFTVGGKAYKNAEYKFDLISEDDDTIDTDQVIKSLTELYQTLAAKNDPRAEQVLQRLAAVGGIYLSSGEFADAQNSAGAAAAAAGQGGQGGGAPTPPGTPTPTAQPQVNGASANSGFPATVKKQ